MLVQLLVRSLGLGSCCGFCTTFLLALVTTATVVKVADVFAVKERLVHPLVDNVVGEAQPTSRCVAAAGLWRILGEKLLEMRRTLAARIESGEQVHEGLEGHSIVLGWLIGESCHHRMEKLPRRVAKFSPVR